MKPRYRPHDKKHAWSWAGGHKACARCGIESTTGAWTPSLGGSPGSYWCRLPGGEWFHYGSAGNMRRLPACGPAVKT